MPTKVKKGVATTILIMMGTSIILGVLSWATIELVKSHDNNISTEYMSKKLQAIEDKQADYDAKVLFLMQSIFDIKLNVKETQININHCVEDSQGYSQSLSKLVDRINDNIHSH